MEAITQRYHDRQVLAWLLTGCALIAAMVVIGGITRLTESGLSMVDWRLIGGTIPPLSERDWMERFVQYKQFPEFKLQHSHFGLAEFKSIFWWEYIHRLLGRLIGIIFLVPCVYFALKKKFRPSFSLRIVLLFVLGAFQGFLGWFMVRSGLVDRPDVSHYRLAIHLLAAFALYAYTLWLALDLWSIERKSGSAGSLTLLRNWVWVSLSVAVLQITYGAFVAGLKAGYVFPTFPKMGAEWIPAQIGLAFASHGARSLFEDITTVQFIHRSLAFVFLICVGFMWLSARRYSLRTDQRVGIAACVSLTAAQFGLGVLTLIQGVPIVLGVLHQLGALAVFTALIFLLHRLRGVCGELSN